MLTPAVDFSADGKLLLCIDRQNNTTILDGVTGKSVEAKPLHAPLGAVFVGDGKRIAAVGDDIAIYDWKTGERVATLPADPHPPGIAPAPNDLGSGAMRLARKWIDSRRHERHSLPGADLGYDPATDSTAACDSLGSVGTARDDLVR